MQPMELPLQQRHPDTEGEPYRHVTIDKKKTEFLRSLITSFRNPGESENHGYGGWQHHGSHHGGPHQVQKAEIDKFPC